jgi:hypothetical protein
MELAIRKQAGCLKYLKKPLNKVLTRYSIVYPQTVNSNGVTRSRRCLVFYVIITRPNKGYGFNR